VPVFKRKVGIMKLIMENWRDYQKQTIEEQQLLDEGVLDVLKKGLGTLANIPAKFEKLVEEAKRNLEANLEADIKELFKEPEMVEAGKEIAAAINKSPLTEEVSSPEELFSISKLRKMGVEEDTLNKIQEKITTTSVEALVKSVEEATNTKAPPTVKAFFVRFTSKFVGAVVFGFIDNFLMVMAGSWIDAKFKIALGALAAVPFVVSGFGNTLSDMVGELGKSTVEGGLKKMGLDPEKVTDSDMERAPKWMRFLDSSAGIIGIGIGCLVGLFAGVKLRSLIGEEKKLQEEKKQSESAIIERKI